MSKPELVIAMLVCGLIAASLAVWYDLARRILAGHGLLAYEPRRGVPWTLGDVFVLGLIWPLGDLIAVRISGGRGLLAEDELSTSLVAALTAVHLLWVALAIAYLVVRVGVSAADLGCDGSHLRADLRLGFLGFLAAVLPVYGLQWLVSQWFEPSEHPLVKLIKDQPNVGLLALASFSAVVVAPVSEELLFRVVLQGWLERRVRLLRRRGFRLAGWLPGLPILVSAAFFATMHQGYDRIALFVLAIFLGYLYQRTHRIFPSIVLHGCVNAVAVLQLWLGEV
jgi:membrane protease YdiL (CAAX protease family)